MPWLSDSDGKDAEEGHNNLKGQQYGLVTEMCARILIDRGGFVYNDGQ